jgi:hypothetical protein
MPHAQRVHYNVHIREKTRVCARVGVLVAHVSRVHPVLLAVPPDALTVLVDVLVVLAAGVAEAQRPLPSEGRKFGEAAARILGGA